MIELKEWAVQILFEGVALSPLSIAIDHLGKHENLPKISEEASLWLWQFSVCRGRSRTDKSEKIQAIVSEVLQLINEDKQQLIKSIRRNFDGPFTEEHLDLWIQDLEAILRLSHGKEKCTWECN